MKKVLQRLIILTLIVTLTIQFNPNPAKAYTASGFNVYYISVGKADCMLLQQGDLYGLVDTGGAANLSAVTNFLDRKGVKTLEFLIITHLDEDHCGNVTSLDSKYTIKSIAYRSLTSTTVNTLSAGPRARYNAMVALSTRQTNPVSIFNSCYDGQSLSLGNATIKFFNRQSSFINDATYASVAESTRINLDSLIFQITYGSTKFFFLGDSGTASNNYVSDKYSASVLKSNVLKVSHHGMSANNTAGIISKVGASIAVNSSSAAFAIEALTVSRLKSANSAVKIYETYKPSSYVATADQAYTYTGMMIISNGSTVKAYGVHDEGATSCNKKEFVK